jgi:hypothetical protein
MRSLGLARFRGPHFRRTVRRAERRRPLGSGEATGASWTRHSDSAEPTLSVPRLDRQWRRYFPTSRLARSDRLLRALMLIQSACAASGGAARSTRPTNTQAACRTRSALVWFHRRRLGQTDLHRQRAGTRDRTLRGSSISCATPIAAISASVCIRTRNRSLDSAQSGRRSLAQVFDARAKLPSCGSLPRPRLRSVLSKRYVTTKQFGLEGGKSRSRSAAT